MKPVPFTPEEWEKIDKFLQGHGFRPLGRVPGGTEYMWPIEEYLSRAKHRPAVRERIKRLNPHGRPEASWPRGWRPHKRLYSHFDAMRVRDFIQRHGSAAYRAVPRTAIIRDGHRKGIAMQYVFNMAPIS